MYRIAYQPHIPHPYGNHSAQTLNGTVREVAGLDGVESLNLCIRKPVVGKIEMSQAREQTECTWYATEMVVAQIEALQPS